ncbi:MAG: hypothetical protein ACM34I_02020 [bacterium]
MLNKVHKELTTGVEKLKWYVSILIERTKIELAVMKILGATEKQEREKREVLVTIGNRVSELSGRKRVNVFEDPEIKDALLKLEKLDKEIQRLKQEIEEITAVEA